MVKKIELNELSEDVTDFNRGYRVGYDAAICTDREEVITLIEDLKDVVAHILLQGDKIGGSHVQVTLSTAELWSLFNRASEALSSSKEASHESE